MPPRDRYLDTWLRRVRKQLAPSGRLSQLARVLAARHGESEKEWSARLRAILEGGHKPSLDLVTEIEALLATAAPPARHQVPSWFDCGGT